jgi:hypothetical protein
MVSFIGGGNRNIWRKQPTSKYKKINISLMAAIPGTESIYKMFSEWSDMSFCGLLLQ